MNELKRFQTDRDLHKNKYEAINEHANIFAELMESVGLDIPKTERPKLKDRLEEFVEMLKQEGIAKTVYVSADVTPIEETVDAYADVLVFAVGAIMKLGYDPEKVIAETGKEINSRVGTMVNGKFEKDTSEAAKANWYKADYTNTKMEVL